MNPLIRRALGLIASAESDRFGSHAMRIAIAIIFLILGLASTQEPATLPVI